MKTDTGKYGNNNKSESVMIPKNVIAGHRESAINTANQRAKEPENNSISNKTPGKIVYNTIFSVAQTRHVEMLYEKYGNKGIRLEELFKSWKTEYSLKSVERLKFYLNLRNVNCSFEGVFPDIKITCSKKEDN